VRPSGALQSFVAILSPLTLAVTLAWAQAAPTSMTFLVRVLRDEGDGESAIVEFVRTGEKQRVYAMATIGTAIAEMAARHRDLAGQRASESDIRRPD